MKIRSPVSKNYNSQTTFGRADDVARAFSHSSNLSCLPGGAFAPPVLKGRRGIVYFSEFKVWFRCPSGAKGFCRGRKHLFRRCSTCGKLGSWLTKREYPRTLPKIFGVIFAFNVPV